MTPEFTDLFARFQRIRQTEGEEAFEKAVREYAEKALEDGDEVISKFAGAAYEAYQAEAKAYREAQASRQAERAQRAAQVQAPPANLDPALVEALRAALPNLRSQAQWNAFVSGFEALRGAMEAIFRQDSEEERKAREALTSALDAARHMTDMTTRLRDVPESAQSPLAEEFRRPPRQFGEADTQVKLMSELTRIGSIGELTRWWLENRKRIDEIVTPGLRNSLMDAVRDKKLLLSSL